MDKIFEASAFKAAPILMMATLVVASLILFGFSRVQAIPEQLLLDLALVYEVILAFVTAVTRHSIPWQEDINRDWSEVAVWIIVFSVVIPNTPGKSFLAALLAALTDPLGLLISIAYGNPMPSPQLMGHLFGPTIFAVILATILSRFIFRMGRDIHAAKQMGSYQLIEKVGTGGMGEVWRARHRMLARDAAVKLISNPGGASSREGVLKRFEREAKATAMLESQHTIRVFDFGTTEDGSFYYVMEFLNGLNLEQLVLRFGPLLPERTIYILQQVCASLLEAHDSGFIHRDIKPANIFLCKKASNFDFVKVLDFGLVRSSPGESLGATALTMDGRITGTPAYIAPESVSGKREIDARADIYSLGCVAYWMLSGELVFDSEDPLQTLLGHLNTEPVPLSSRTELAIPAELEALVHECLEKNPDNRPQGVKEVARRLANTEVPSRWTQQRAERWWRKNLPLETHHRTQPAIG
jgi:serine/threonine-protein kinase